MHDKQSLFFAEEQIYQSPELNLTVRGLPGFPGFLTCLNPLTPLDGCHTSGTLSTMLNTAYFAICQLQRLLVQSF